MDDDDQTAAPEPSAEQAFDLLRGEVSLLRRAIEALTSERQAAPDYSPSLAAISKQQAVFVTWANKIAETPLLMLTPESMRQDIERIAFEGRAADHAIVETAYLKMLDVVGRLDQVTDSAWAADRQLRLLFRTGLACFLAGVLLCASVIAIDNRMSGRSPDRPASIEPKSGSVQAQSNQTHRVRR
jgi:hypothetical protein